MRIQILVRRAGLLLVASQLWAAGTAQAALPDPPNPEAPIDLLDASLTQQDSHLRWTVRTRDPVSAKTLAAQSGQHLCLLLTYGDGDGDGDGPRSRICMAGGDDSHLSMRLTRLTDDGRPSSVRALAGSVKGATTRTVKATFEIAAAGLSERRFRWRVQATGVGAPGCATREAPPCVDVLPDSGKVPARTVAPVPPQPIGCVRRGAAQVSRMPGHPNAVALTFDDGPSRYTSQVLRILEGEHVPATFFEVGAQMAGRARLLRRMLADGDAIGNHTYTHANVAGGGSRSQITRTQRAIRSATGYTPCIFRPPYGATSGALVSEVRALGLTSVLWSVDPRDWTTPGTGAIRARVLSQARRGGIVLMHDGGGPRSQTVAALRGIIRTFKARHYRFMTVPAALGYKPVFKQQPAG